MQGLMVLCKKVWCVHNNEKICSNESVEIGAGRCKSFKCNKDKNDINELNLVYDYYCIKCIKKENNNA